MQLQASKVEKYNSRHFYETIPVLLRVLSCQFGIANFKI